VGTAAAGAGRGGRAARRGVWRASVAGGGRTWRRAPASAVPESGKITFPGSLMQVRHFGYSEVTRRRSGARM
jgi:hypothetical protein